MSDARSDNITNKNKVRIADKSGLGISGLLFHFLNSFTEEVSATISTDPFTGEVIEEVIATTQQLKPEFIEPERPIFNIKSTINEIDVKVKHEKKLGSGAYAVVYVGEWNKIEVAVKTSDIKTPKRLETCKRELEILEKLKHDNNANIVAYFGAFIKNDVCYMVSEYMKGGSLGNFLFESNKTLNWKEFFLIAKDILNGVNYLHSQDIIHRDLKPENILLSSQDPIADVKICDLGLAVSIHSIHIKQAGTPGYSAPEVIKKERPTASADIYSVAKIMLEMRTKKRACFGQHSDIYKELVSSEKQTDFSDENKQTGVFKVAHLINLGLDRNPAKRPTAKDILVNLQEIESSNLQKMMDKI